MKTPSLQHVSSASLTLGGYGSGHLGNQGLGDSGDSSGKEDGNETEARVI